MSVDPDEPLDFASEPDSDDLIDQLRRTVKESYDNGYRDGRVDQHMLHAEHCPNVDAQLDWWRDRGDAMFPPYPPPSLMIAAIALYVAGYTFTTTAFFYVTVMWLTLAFLVRLGLIVTVHWNGRGDNDNDNDNERDD